MKDEKDLSGTSLTGGAGVSVSVPADAAPHAAAHTPGPWFVTAADSDDEPWVNVECDEWVVARVWADTSALPADANAHLIAAAPELLKALKRTEYAGNEIRLQGGGGIPTCPLCRGRKYDSDGEEIREHKPDCALVAAIRKAEGR